MSDYLNVPPDSWISVQLGELTAVHYGKSLAAGNRNTDGAVPVFGSSGPVGNHSEALVDGPCIVVGRKGAAGAVHLVRESSWPIDTAYFIQPPKEIDLVYLAYSLGTLELGQLDKSTAIPSLSRDDLYRVNIALAPLAEQTRIVAKLEELLSDLDAGVAELKAAQKKLGQYRQSLLKAAVEGALTAEWRIKNTPTETGAQLLQRILSERRARWEAKQLAKFAEQGKAPPKDWQKKYPEPVQPDTSDLPALPEGWVWARVDHAGTVQLGRQRAPQFHNGENMVPYLRVANVFEERIDISDVMEMHFSKQDEETYLLSPGDILLNEGQSLELIGRPAIYRGELPRACFTNTLVRFSAENEVLSEYAISVFLHYMHSGRFRKIAKITTNIAHLGAGRFAALEFPLPPINEQKEIVGLLQAAMEDVIRQGCAIALALKQATAQRQNILRAAFAGQLVPQDPNDEPASVLLERIRAERAERGKQPKTRQPKKQKEMAVVASKLIDVLTDAGDWLEAQEAFRRCGVGDGTLTERIEELYAELRKLDKAGRLAVEAIKDKQGRKTGDRIKLLAG